VEQPHEAVRVLVAAYAPRVGAHRGLDGQRVLQQARPQRVLVEQRQRFVAVGKFIHGDGRPIVP
jgi:hypothetical protein